MFIITVDGWYEDGTNTVQTKLGPNQVVDPRPIEEEDDEIEHEHWVVEWTDGMNDSGTGSASGCGSGCGSTTKLTITIKDQDGDVIEVTFLCSVNTDGDGARTVLTVTNQESMYVCDEIVLRFRVYDSAMEIVPDFRSSTYEYMGIEGERAPRSTVVGRVHESVQTIRWFAFYKCDLMKRCVMDGDQVEVIEDYAFQGCSSLYEIQLSRSLQSIGAYAFYQCFSIYALLFPSTLKDVEDGAFEYCRRLRIISPFPPDTRVGLRGNIFRGCDALFEIEEIVQYEYEPEDEEEEYPTNHTLVHQSIVDLHRNLPPLHRICLDPSVTVQMIQEHFRVHGPSGAYMVDQYHAMNPLHILAINPHLHATPEIMMAYLEVAPLDTIFIPDGMGMTPLDYMIKSDNLEGHTYLMQALCLHRDAWKSHGI